MEPETCRCCKRVLVCGRCPTVAPEPESPMKRYRVVWEIDIDAESHEEAASEALSIQRDPNSIATCFDVVEIDESGKHLSGSWTFDLDYDVVTESST